ncbi:DMT family transporter [Brevibacillus sp. TJ4]|uniref:DMT family transporter n=1 Tax=Brevibacillus sp. TJ4 TaxID=3234853 RepID=UPI0037D7076C
MKPQLKADLAMLVVTLFWGSSYVFMQLGLGDLEPFNLIALRFLLAFFLAFPLLYPRIKRPEGKTLLQAFVLGGLLFGVFATITTGIKSTTASQAGFLVSLTVIFVPLLSVFLGAKPPARVFAGACTALLGIALMTLSSSLQMSEGDALCIAGALFYASHILVTGRWAGHSDPLQLGVYQLGFTAVFALLFSFLLETPRLPESGVAWVAVLALGILCSAIGFIVQTVAQRYTSASHTAVIFSMEPVFAAVFAFLVFGEMLSLRGYIGAALVLVGLLIAELDGSRWLPHKKRREIPPASRENMPV